MRIVVFADWFSEPMGYSHNFLPKALARLGHDVHLVTSNGHVYCTTPQYRDVFESYLGPPFVSPGVTAGDGFTIHRLPSEARRGQLHIRGLTAKLRELRPDVVQTSHLAGPVLEIALARPRLGFRLFLDCHVHASVFPVAQNQVTAKERFFWWRYSRTTGRLISSQTEKCYAISTDAADIAIRFFGMQRRKVAVSPLGVDTTLFAPAQNDEARHAFRSQLGFSRDDIICIYTGRISHDKGPQYLADAVAMLAGTGEPFKGLFVGHGATEDIKAIAARPGCVIHPFVMCRDLPMFYRAADIGVWPRQESTSQIDAAACGLPLVLSHRVHVRERVNGNGLLYQEGNASDLAERLRELASPAVRRRMGERGAQMMRAYDWSVIAAQRVADFNASL